MILYIILYYIILYYIILYYIILYCIVLYCLFCIVLGCIMLRCVVLYYTILIEKDLEVQRVSDRIIFKLVKLIVGQRVVTFLSVYAPQSCLSDEVKDLFFDQLRAVTARIPASEFLIPCGDWNGNVVHAGTGHREVHDGMGYGRPEPDVVGERILEYALAFELLLGNTCFKKRDSHLITYKSGNIATQIDFVLFRRTKCKLVTE